MTTHQQDANLRRYFDQQAARYGRDPLTRWLGRHEMAALAELAPPAPEPGVTPALDFGCGTGRASDVLLRCGYRVTGYDLSEAMVAQARRNLEAKPGLVLTTDRESVAGPWPLVAAMGVLDYHADTASLW
ncbi:MAG: class I SAM-dependent methyltransferase, partial [Caldilineales bacterium]